MEQQDGVPTQDNANISLTPNTGNPDMVQVRVLAESGIFKNGVQYAQGESATITRHSAAGLVATGDVEYVTAPQEGQPNA